MIKFIGYMMKYVLSYREQMFQFEDFKKNVKGEDKLILLVEYEKQVRNYVKKYEEAKLLLETTMAKIHEEQTIRKDV